MKKTRPLFYSSLLALLLAPNTLKAQEVYNMVLENATKTVNSPSKSFTQVKIAQFKSTALVYLKKTYDHCLELGITRKELSSVIKSSLVFSIVPSLSIVVGLFVLIAVLGSVWAWWRLSVIGSLSYETMISSSIAQVLGYVSSAEMLESATGRQFGVVMILMSVGMLSGFLILLPSGKKLCKSVDRSAADNGAST